MRVLELGNYIAPAYAGMILAEQGHYVEKWTIGTDPILALRRGDEIWRWINHGKMLLDVTADKLIVLRPGEFDIIIDNFRPAFWERMMIDPAVLALLLNVKWVSLRSEVGDTSFDALAQARSWMEYAPYVPFYVGDTAAGLWMAFKACVAQEAGHYIVGHASCLQKMVEGELIIDEPRDFTDSQPPWDEAGAYGFDGTNAVVKYRDREYVEPIRDRHWKLKHLFHVGGRIKI